MPDGEQREAAFYLHVEIVCRFKRQPFDARRPVVETDLQAYRAGLDQVWFYPHLAKEGIELSRSRFLYKGKVFGVQLYQHLVLFEDDDGWKPFHRIVVDHRARQRGIEKALYIKWDILVLQRFDGLGMDDLGTIIGHLDDLVIVEFAEDLRVGKLFGIGIHHPFHILPDGQAFRVEQVGKDRGGIVAAFAAEGGAFVVLRRADESLREDHVVLAEERDDIDFDPLSRNLHIDGGIAEIGVGAEDIANIDPLVADAGLGEESAR